MTAKNTNGVSNKYINTKQLAALICSTQSSIQARRCTGELDIPYIKLGRKVLYDMDDVVLYLNSNKVGGGNYAV